MGLFKSTEKEKTARRRFAYFVIDLSIFFFFSLSISLFSTRSIVMRCQKYDSDAFLEALVEK